MASDPVKSRLLGAGVFARNPRWTSAVPCCSALASLTAQPPLPAVFMHDKFNRSTQRADETSMVVVTKTVCGGQQPGAALGLALGGHHRLAGFAWSAVCGAAAELPHATLCHALSMHAPFPCPHPQHVYAVGDEDSDEE